MKNLTSVYKEWRTVTENDIEEGCGGTTDCGEKCVREDFSNYAKLETEITFEEMFELENNYEA